MPLPERASRFDHVQVEIILHLSALVKVPAFRHTLFEFRYIYISDALQQGNEPPGFFQGCYSNEDVDGGFRRQPGNGGAADVLDLQVQAIADL